ncbi:hypothetical protein DJ018_02825 [Phenylobacterium deserti]|uniref:Uncharacterized protein n=1 Tax=Phenylobacterium deserti TaxID=1914756 RepID=A0A328ARN8_9CAUL|nr:hypothetical protein DJ018_02825 [Phenylobacterium deserti]
MIRWIDRSGLRPWSGLFVGAAAWVLQHQIGSDLVYWDCRLGTPLLTGGLGLVAAGATVLGGLISWRARRARPGEGEPGNRAFAGMVGAATAGIFLLAILFQSLIGFMVPACHA